MLRLGRPYHQQMSKVKKEYTVCSECGSHEYTWKNCTNDTKKCINCSGPHRTLANKCPRRKEIKDHKRKERKTPVSYNQALKGNTSTLPNAADWLKKETASTILTCIIYAHINNLAIPGSYNSKLNKVFRLNNIPPIILPDNPPSKEILSLAASAPAPANLGNNDQEEHEDNEEEEEKMEEVEVVEEEQQEVT
ncbi:hypothetical protein E2C01_016921 [Portunus trituberculatus]|uniref:Uncharacterized protein n=1 Tax=Portunus trituberculatus TaxID=210409 RepID=A0A5B7DS19_PORTR|nr:hypothetical protein [Portunus trituberculatus]